MAPDTYDIVGIKERYGIVGNDAMFNQAINTAIQVAPTQLPVLIIGESGSGKENFPQIIHYCSKRRHKQYIAVNCGAIPEGTIDSELFGHEKGSFTGALSDRKGYFEEANGGTIFLDEIGELPLTTQAKLLRILEKGEYIKVGSSVVKKTDVRIVAATNVDLEQAIATGKFREDLFYRLNGVMIRIPALRQRKDDIPLLFYKFTSDFAERNKIPSITKLTSGALNMLCEFPWPGNVRQLKNVAEQITVLSDKKLINEEELERFLPHSDATTTLPLFNGLADEQMFNNEREILYKLLFDMRSDINEMKKLIIEMHNHSNITTQEGNNILPANQVIYEEHHNKFDPFHTTIKNAFNSSEISTEDESVTISDSERELIIKTLNKHRGRRRPTAEELGVSERTLYRKLRAYNLI